MCIRSTTLLQLFISLMLAGMSACDSTEPSEVPAPPRIISVSDTTQVNQTVDVVAVAVSADNTPLTYEIDWGDKRGLQSVPDVESGLYVTLQNRYFDPGNYSMRCRVIDAGGRLSAWSQTLQLHVYGQSVVGKGDWWMFMHDAQHTGRSSYQGPLSPVLLWKYHAASPIRSSATFDAYGHVYVGADDFRLHAILPGGAPRWQYWSGNAQIQNSPAIASDGSVYFGGSSANIYRINRFGLKEWNTSTNTAITTSSVALDDDGSIYIGSEDGGLYCLDNDGIVVWQMVTNGPITGSPALSRDATRIYFGSSDRILYAADRQGNLVWTYPTGGAISGSPSIGPHGSIFFGSEDNYVYALTMNGNLRWKHNLHAAVRSAPAIGIEGHIYVVTSDGVLYCFDNAGTVIWDLRFSSAGADSSPILDILETVYVSDIEGILYAVSRSGKLLWQYDTEAPVHSTPSIGPNGIIVIGDDDGILHAIGDK
ncbi:MAG: hypothetical protein C0600_14025 [Ignavibacteria bacterium]|nr:MAG: hypothetical protein C0600_14025 [Ignavibacteria bacterium]